MRKKGYRMRTKSVGTCAEPGCGQQATPRCLLYVCCVCKKGFCSAHVGAEEKCESCAEKTAGKPSNMVIKMTTCDGLSTIKLSDSPGKAFGTEEEIAACKEVLQQNDNKT